MSNGAFERRRARRTAYGANVRVEAEIAWGMNISPLGLAVEVAQCGNVGDIVRVALSPGSADGSLPEIGAPARIVRIDRTPRGALVGLQFLDPAQY